MTTDATGGTVSPHNDKLDSFPGRCVNDKPHGKGQWVWELGVWTNRIRCQNCGVEYTPTILQGKAP